MEHKMLKEFSGQGSNIEGRATGEIQLHQEHKVVLKQVKTMMRHRSREHSR
jgi:hypothetical protein